MPPSALLEADGGRHCFDQTLNLRHEGSIGQAPRINAIEMAAGGCITIRDARQIGLRVTLGEGGEDGVQLSSALQKSKRISPNSC